MTVHKTLKLRYPRCRLRFPNTVLAIGHMIFETALTCFNLSVIMFWHYHFYLLSFARPNQFKRPTVLWPCRPDAVLRGRCAWVGFCAPGAVFSALPAHSMWPAEHLGPGDHLGRRWRPGRRGVAAVFGVAGMAFAVRRRFFVAPVAFGACWVRSVCRAWPIKDLVKTKVAVGALHVALLCVAVGFVACGLLPTSPHLQGEGC